MCSRYQPPGVQQLEEFSQTRLNPFPAYKPDTWPGYLAPIITRLDPKLVRLGRFGMLGQHGQPVLAGPTKRPASTFNARSEDIAKRPTYRNAWRNLQTCIVPALAFFEPCYELEGGKKSFPMRISRTDGHVMAIAGLFERHLQEDAVAPLSFTMLTLNAATHPLMSRMHKPDDEKRSIVILEPDEIGAWLNVRSEDEMRSFVDLFDAELCQAEQAPPAPRAGRLASR